MFLKQFLMSVWNFLKRWWHVLALGGIALYYVLRRGSVSTALKLLREQRELDAKERAIISKIDEKLADQRVKIEEKKNKKIKEIEEKLIDDKLLIDNESNEKRDELQEKTNDELAEELGREFKISVEKI